MRSLVDRTSCSAPGGSPSSCFQCSAKSFSRPTGTAHVCCSSATSFVTLPKRCHDTVKLNTCNMYYSSSRALQFMQIQIDSMRINMLINQAFLPIDWNLYRLMPSKYKYFQVATCFTKLNLKTLLINMQAIQANLANFFTVKWFAINNL